MTEHFSRRDLGDLAQELGIHYARSLDDVASELTVVSTLRGIDLTEIDIVPDNEDISVRQLLDETYGRRSYIVTPSEIYDSTKRNRTVDVYVDLIEAQHRSSELHNASVEFMPFANARVEPSGERFGCDWELAMDSILTSTAKIIVAENPKAMYGVVPQYDTDGAWRFGYVNLWIQRKQHVLQETAPEVTVERTTNGPARHVLRLLQGGKP